MKIHVYGHLAAFFAAFSGLLVLEDFWSALIVINNQQLVSMTSSCCPGLDELSRRPDVDSSDETYVLSTAAAARGDVVHCVVSVATRGDVAHCVVVSVSQATRLIES